jgi:3-dehydroquinate synthetase
LSVRVATLPAVDSARIKALVERAGLRTQAPELGADRYLELMARDKKVQAGALRLVLLEALGRASVRSDIPQSALRALLTMS